MSSGAKFKKVHVDTVDQFVSIIYWTPNMYQRLFNAENLEMTKNTHCLWPPGVYSLLGKTDNNWVRIEISVWLQWEVQRKKKTQALWEWGIWDWPMLVREGFVEEMMYKLGCKGSEELTPWHCGRSEGGSEAELRTAFPELFGKQHLVLERPWCIHGPKKKPIEAGTECREWVMRRLGR